MRSGSVLVVIGGLLAMGCNRVATPATMNATPIPVLTEAFLTSPIADVNVDSVAVWRRGSPALLIATAKTGNTLLVYDAATGQALRRIGVTGTGAGQLRRPNGILILDDYAFVVERDNHRVQVFALPSGESVALFGDTALRRPYGITGYADGDGYVMFVTDNYEASDGTYPPDAELDERVHRFRVSRNGAMLHAAHEAAFGDTRGPGVLRKVETIMVDPAEQRLLVAEEDSRVRSLQIYTPEGRFTGSSISGWFATEPEGVALVPCGGGGYWVATDQHPEASRNIFHVFERGTLKHRGSFRGAVTHTTDGVTATVGTIGALAGGGFYALHNDAQVAAFSWDAIEKALSLDACAGQGSSTRALQ